MDVERSAQDFRSRLGSVLGRVQPSVNARTSLRRHGDRWTIRARVGAFRVFRVSSRMLTIDSEELGLPADQPLSIVEAGIEAHTLTVALEALTPGTAADWETILGNAEDALQALVGDEVRAAFLRRGLRGVRKVAAHVPLDAVADATAEPTDIAVLVRAFTHPDVLEPLRRDDALAPARLRGLQQRERLLQAEGGTWDAATVASHLRLTRQAVNRRRQKGTLLALDAGRRGFIYPAWQFTRRGTLAGLDRVLDALRPHDPWMQQAFALAPNVRLDGQTPLAGLRAGRADEVVAAASAYGMHGAA